MMNILLFVHVVIALLLIIVILMQKTGSDGLSGIGVNNMGVVSGRTVANFLIKTTVVLTACFIINAIVLANLSSKRDSNIVERLDQLTDNKPTETTSLPIAK